MTSHLFRLKSECDISEVTSWSISRFLVSSYDRSILRLKVKEEVEPPQLPHFRKENLRQNENAFKADSSDYPYVCFLEQTGLLVAVSFCGYVGKFAIEIDLDSDSQTLPHNE